MPSASRSPTGSPNEGRPEENPLQLPARGGEKEPLGNPPELSAPLNKACPQETPFKQGLTCPGFMEPEWPGEETRPAPAGSSLMQRKEIPQPQALWPPGAT